MRAEKVKVLIEVDVETWAEVHAEAIRQDKNVGELAGELLCEAVRRIKRG